MKKIKNNLYFVKMFAFTLIAALVLIGESRAAATCAWESVGSTKLIISGDGIFNENDCALSNWRSRATAIEIKSGITEIGKRAFQDMPNVTSLTLGNTLKTINEDAFSGMTGLTGALIIPDSVTTIENSAFYNLNKVTNVKIGDSVTYIGKSAFRYMVNVTGLTIGKSVKTIEQFAFEGMNNLTVLEIPDSVETIGKRAFNIMSSVTKLTIGKSVKTIGEEAFLKMENVTDLTIPNSVTEIGNGAFSGMSGVSGSLIIPPSVKTISNKAFKNMSGVTGSLVIPNSVTRIQAEAFNGMNKVTDLTIPSSVTYIGPEAFKNMAELKTLTIPDNLNTSGWDSNVFKNLKAKNVTISCIGNPESCKTAMINYISTASGGGCSSSCLTIAAIIPENEYLCEIPDKKLDCSMLHYTYSSAQKDAALKNPAMVCTQCPTDADYWSCATRATDASQYIPLTSFDITPKTGGVSGCVALPTCENLGYVFSSVKVSGVPASYSCSACPFDGSKWACAGSGGLVKPRN